MSRFDICRLRPAGPGSSGPELVVVLQSDLLSDLDTRMVAPLARERDAPPIGKLRPHVTLRGRKYRIVIDRMNVVGVRYLGEVVGSAASLDYEIGRAIDAVFLGF
jgi:toxin CcdB